MDSKVDIVLKLDELSIEYLVKFEPDEALEFLGRAIAYNNFTSAMLVKLIKEINKLIPLIRFPNPDNPNNGEAHHKFYIGNEGSRVIYLKIDKFYLQPDFQGKEFDYNNLTQQLKKLADSAYADEFALLSNNEYEYKCRFWWD